MNIAVSVSAQGYGNEAAFDYRAEMTGHLIIKPSTGHEFLNMLADLCQYQKSIYLLKIFSHSYPRGIIMSNWSGFYDEPGPSDTKRAAYLSDLADRIYKGEIRFITDSQILLFGCDLGSFSQKLSSVTGGIVVGADGGTYPEIWGNRETGVFVTTGNWLVYKNGSLAYNAGKRYRAW
ncbi:MAG: hypothetical protein GXW90_06065 [Tepidanaerobacter acetatoxydans]|uniref:hypothetical protein n=1 Tax=Tepidanaerobacter TaxID=499228 RepID=UPI000A4B5668|nr:MULTISPECIES: hypothetical protein [Tepidanaerobacter]NLU10490.1 hypothetical protein [Tepidanaerobacter acetatoxydans]